MKKIFISIAIGAFSTLAMAKFVMFIPNEAGSKYTIDTIDTIDVDCIGKATTDRNALIAKIDAWDDVTKFDTKCITDFSELFSHNRSGANQSVIVSFNQDIGAWDVSSGTNFRSMFDGARTFNKNIGSWDVSSGTDFRSMFSEAHSFNQDIGSWDVSSGTNFRSMFDDARTFNKNIGSWDVSSGTDFSYMFSEAHSFDKDIGSWDVSSGTDFSYMFSKASSFNKDIHLWDVENATSYSDFRSYSQLTNDNTPFKFGGSDQDSDGDGVSDHTEVYNDTDPLDPDTIDVDCIGKATTDRNALIAKIDAWDDVTKFDTKCITDFSELFSHNRSGANQSVIVSFNQDISAWDVSSGTNFRSMFDGARTFNKNIGSWDVSSGTDFRSMFDGATTFNQDIGAWDVSSGTDFSSMFDGATTFNQDIGAWDVSSGTDFSYMFSEAHSFDKDIGSWDVSSGTDFSYMFSKASSFNKDIHLWDVENATSYSDFRSYSQLTNDNTPFKFSGSDQDSDGDGVSDHTEVYNDTDPLDPASL